MKTLRCSPGTLFRLRGFGRLVPALLGITLLALGHVPIHAAPPPVYRWTTLAGRASIGSEDGSRTDARFNRPHALAFDAVGNLYVADTGNHIIRRITPAGVVSTFAGKSGEPGATDGPATAARFHSPQGLAVDRIGNVYVADTGNHTIRLITPGGIVSTVAGQAGQAGAKDGAASAARFDSPDRLAVDSQGNLYLSNLGIRKISGGTVSTVSVPAQVTDPDGNALTVRLERCPAIDAEGNLYFATINPATGIVAGPSRSEQYLKVSPGGVPSIVRSSFYGTDNSGSTYAWRYYEDTLFSDHAGNLLVAIELHNYRAPTQVTVARMQPDGKLVSSNLQLRDRLGNAVIPLGLALDAAGKWYYTSAADHAIGSSEGVFAGTALPTEGIDGTGPAARLNSVDYLAVDPARNVWVAETVLRMAPYVASPRLTAETLLRKIAPGGEVTTPEQPWYRKSSWSYGLYPTGLYADGAGTVTLVRLANDASQEFRLNQVFPAGSITEMSGPSGYVSNPVSDLSGRLVVLNNFYLSGQAQLSYYRIAQREADGSWSTLAGGPSDTTPAPAVDGIGASARFRAPTALTSDHNGNLYLVDATSGTTFSIRKVTANGTVTTVTDRLSARPNGLAASPSGTLYLSYSDAHLVTRVGTDGKETVIGGSRDTSGSRDGIAAALFAFPGHIALDAQENLYVIDGDGATVRKGELLGYAPEIATQPASASATTGASVTFAVTVSTSAPVTFQWYFNGTALGGATSNTLALANVSSAHAGDYTVVVANEVGSVTSNKATLTVNTPTPPLASGGSSGGAGGGAPSLWFGLAIVALVAWRQRNRRSLA